MKNRIKYPMLGLLTFLLAISFLACDDDGVTRRVDPQLTVQDALLAGPAASRKVINLKSTYPWFSEASAPWIKLSKYRGQAFYADSIVAKLEENPSMETREGWIEIRLMDQLTQRIRVTQGGRGSLITLAKSSVFFNVSGGTVNVDVVTDLDWDISEKSKDGFSFEKLPTGQLKITAARNTTGVNKTVKVDLFDKANPQSDARTSISVVQLIVEKMLSITLSDEEKDMLVERKGMASFSVPLTLNAAYECTSSDSWISVIEAPAYTGNQVDDINVRVEFKANTTGEDRIGYLVVKEKTATNPISDTLFVCQNGVSRIVYVKPGGSGDGSSWEHALGSFADANSKVSNGEDVAIWVAQGEYQFTGSAVKRAVNSYGGFKGDETRLSQRDLTRKSVFKGGAYIMIQAWASTDRSRTYFMDGFELTGTNVPEGTGVGSLEFYPGHGLRNCIIRDNAYGKNAAGYFEGCVLINCLVYNNETGKVGASVIQCNGSKFINVTVAKNRSSTPAGPGVRMNGSNPEGYNMLVWGNEPLIPNASTRTIYIDSNKGAALFNCAIDSDYKFNNGNVPTDGSSGNITLSTTNEGAIGPNFTNVSGFDFTLQSSSAVIGKGLNTILPSYGVAVDIFGRLRPAGKAPCIGATEYIK